MLAENVEDDEEVMSFFEKFSYDTFPSKYLKYLEIPAWDCRETLEEEPVLHMSDKGVTDDDAIALGRAMSIVKPEQLRRLYMTRNKLTGIGCAALAAGAKDCPNMEIFYMQKNQIGDDGLAGIATHLRKSKVAQIVLSNNAVGDAGVKAFASVLADGESFAHLRTLYLDNNPNITDEGVCALAKVLHCMPSIEIVALQECGFGDKGMRALAEAIGKGGIFTPGRENWLYVFKNAYSDAAKMALKEACKGQCTLHARWPPPAEGIDMDDFDD